MDLKQLTSSREGILPVVLFAVFAGATVLWLSVDRVPPNWDDAWYLVNSLTVYDALTHGGLAGYLAKLNSVFGFKAPLIAALPTPFYLLFGRRWHAAYLVNIVSMALLFSAVYRIARRCWNTRAALLAIAIAGTMPLLYGLARWFLVEYALTALVAAAICVLVESDGVEEPRRALLFGTASGLGLLLKVSFPVFVLPAYVHVWIRDRHRARSLVIASLACIVLALPWYVSHVRPTIENAVAAGFGESATVQGTGPIFTLRAITTYLSRVAREGVSSYYVWLIILLSGWTLFRSEGRLFLRSLTRGAPALLLFWLLPFVIFLFGGNKDVRYIAPILPGFALLSAALLDFAVPRTALGNALAGLILLVPFLQMCSVSFRVPFQRPELGYARHFVRVEWPLGEILKTVLANSSLKPGERQVLLVGSDAGSFNANNVDLAAVADQLPFDVETTAHEKDLNTLLQSLRQASFFLYKEGGEPESPVFNPHFDELVRHARQDGYYTPLAYERRLPDGGIARILKNSAGRAESVKGAFLAAGLEQAEEFAIELGGMMALTGASIRTTPDSVIVTCRWRCLKRPDRNYLCFMHVIDSKDRIISQLDHRILGGMPPLQSWNAGDAGIEEVHLRLPAESSGAILRLRFGLYDPPSGDRLRFGVLQGLPASRFTPADQSTALIAPI